MGETHDAKASAPSKEWTHATDAIGHLEYAVRRGLGTAAVRQALDDAATDLAIYVDNAGEKDLAARTAIWRRRIRPLVNASGDDIDESALVALYGDVANAQVRNAMTHEVTGVTVSKRADGHFALKLADGRTLLTLPPLAGEAVRGAPKKYAAQIQLLAAAADADDPEALRRHAMNVFSNVHEREHEALEQRLLYKPTEARAGAFINGLTNLRSATTPAEKTKAEAILRTALFAEAAPAKRLAYLGLDLFTPVGNLNSAVGLRQETAAAYKDLSEGRYLDGAMHTVWSAVELVGAVSGIRASRLLREAAKTTPIGRRVVAARDLARMEAHKQRKHPAVRGEVVFGPRRWNRMTQDQRGYFDGMFNNAKGQVGEAQMRQTFADVGAPSFQNKRALEDPNKTKPVSKSENPTVVHILKEHGGGERHFDDALVGATLQRHLKVFLFPKQSYGQMTLVENKAAGAGPNANQRKLDPIIEANSEKYGNAEILRLRQPYNELNKKDLRATVKRLMSDPDLMGQRYSTTGVIKKSKDAPGKFRTVKWEPEILDRMIADADRSLRMQQWKDQAPTVADFLFGVAARAASQASTRDE